MGVHSVEKSLKLAFTQSQNNKSHLKLVDFVMIFCCNKFNLCNECSVSRAVSIEQNMKNILRFRIFGLFEKLSFIIRSCISIQYFVVPCSLQALDPPRKFQRPPFWND